MKHRKSEPIYTPDESSSIWAQPHHDRSRRDALTCLAGAAVAGLGWPAAAQSKPLRLASTFDNSGVERANGSGCFQGALACIDAVNRNGGVGGSKIELVMADDEFKPELAKKNAATFRADKSILGLLTPLGTRQTAAVMEAVQDMAIVGPNTGTAALRKTSPSNLFWVRASYDQEVDKLIGNAITLGVSRIGIVYPNDPLGKSVLGAFERSMAERRLKPAVVATTPNTTSKEVEPAAKAVAEADPQLVIMVLAGVAPLFVQTLRDLGSACTLYGLSISASTVNIKAMGDKGRGVGFALIVPSPFAPKYEIVRRYQADMTAAGHTELSLPSLEGYINARVMVEGLRRAGQGVTRESLIAALDRIEALDLGGMRIGYGRGNRIGGQFVDVAVIGPNGRLMA